MQVMAPNETASAPRTARAVAREMLTSQILETARAHLVERGAGELSLRAVARELGMASSAVYRYFPSRDALLTALIIDAYNALGEAAEEADAAVDRDDHLGRWRSIGHAVRNWAIAHPHEYALIYGTPVPGYEAPQDTIDPASRVTLVLLRLLLDMPARPWDRPVPIDDELAEQVRTVRELSGLELPDEQILRGITAWVLLYGLVNFELFGSFKNTFDDAGPVFAHQLDLMAVHMGLAI